MWTYVYKYTEPVSASTALRNFLWSCNTLSPSLWHILVRNLKSIVPQAKTCWQHLRVYCQQTSESSIQLIPPRQKGTNWDYYISINPLPSISWSKTTLYLWAEMFCLDCQIRRGVITLIICNYHSNSQSDRCPQPTITHCLVKSALKRCERKWNSSMFLISCVHKGLHFPLLSFLEILLTTNR